MAKPAQPPHCAEDLFQGFSGIGGKNAQGRKKGGRVTSTKPPQPSQEQAKRVSNLRRKGQGSWRMIELKRGKRRGGRPRNRNRPPQFGREGDRPVSRVITPPTWSLSSPHLSLRKKGGPVARPRQRSATPQATRSRRGAKDQGGAAGAPRRLHNRPFRALPKKVPHHNADLVPGQGNVLKKKPPDEIV